ncbi:MAG TPA: DNA-3-methyladenine glycosylase [Chthoniobacterales bacterium]|nr:DNA-3-methyladenine glycosylase [Chthoniobacterales bacterium]
MLVKGENPEHHGFVLVRAVEPFQGIEVMRERRSSLGRSQSCCINEDELCNGPGKLTRAFAIDGSHHGIDLFHDPNWSFKKSPHDFFQKKEILSTPRIGISQARERLWRFVLVDLTHKEGRIT